MGSLDAAIMTGFICRLCSKMNRCVIHMYGEEGRRLKLVSRIKEYLPVVVSMTGSLFILISFYNESLPFTNLSF